MRPLQTQVYSEFRNNTLSVSIFESDETLIAEYVLDLQRRNQPKRIKIGDRFCVNFSNLERRNQRVFYCPSGIVCEN
jgi:hypothetical protein